MTDDVDALRANLTAQTLLRDHYEALLLDAEARIARVHGDRDTDVCAPPEVVDQTHVPRPARGVPVNLCGECGGGQRLAELEARIEAAQLIFDQDWNGPNRATAIAMYTALTGDTAC